MAVFAFLLVAAACVFFLYALVQFRLEEKHPRRRSEMPIGIPVISSGQIVIPPQPPREKQHKDSADQKAQDASENGG